MVIFPKPVTSLELKNIQIYEVAIGGSKVSVPFFGKLMCFPLANRASMFSNVFLGTETISGHHFSARGHENHLNAFIMPQTAQICFNCFKFVLKSLNEHKLDAVQ